MVLGGRGDGDAGTRGHGDTWRVELRLCGLGKIQPCVTSRKTAGLVALRV